jgi:hypothetical protein
MVRGGRGWLIQFLDDDRFEHLGWDGTAYVRQRADKKP